MCTHGDHSCILVTESSTSISYTNSGIALSSEHKLRTTAFFNKSFYRILRPNLFIKYSNRQPHSMHINNIFLKQNYVGSPTIYPFPI